MRGAPERLVAVLRDDAGVLHADAELAGQVDAGLVGHDGAEGARLVVAAAEVRALVNLQADAVAEAVLRGVRAATGLPNLPAARDLAPAR